jgi:hypothetical protein
VKRLVERALRRLWGPRWNAIARGEFRMSFTDGAVVGLAVFALLVDGAVAAVWIWGGPVWAGQSARLVAVLAWFVAAGFTAGPMGQLFMLDEKLGTTEGWLLTPAPRQEILWARLAGHSAQGPLLILGLFPVYCVAAASLHGAFHGLFVCGHLARLAGSFGPADFTIPSVAAAAPVALLAMLADMAAGLAMGASAAGQALHRAGGRGILLSHPGKWLQWQMATFMDSLALTTISLLIEGGAAAVSGLAAVWMMGAASLPLWSGTVIGLALGAVLAALLADRRLALTATRVKFAADRYDEALIRDGPE